MEHRIIQGDCIEGLRTLADASVHCCVTSPPYWGLRDYGHDRQIGLESTPEAYVARMVEVFREVRRVLREDGTLWLNLGDSYCGGGGYAPDAPCNKRRAEGESWGAMNAFSTREGEARKKSRPGYTPPGLKPKDLVGIPWRVAFALQTDGWWLRQDIIWHKPNPMPESVRDRCTKAHEYVFLLTKSERYFYDADAVSEPSVEMTRPQSEKRRLQRMNRGVVTAGAFGQSSKGVDGGESPTHIMRSGERRNRRSVWTVTTKPYKGAHFATMPPDLVEPCVLAGTSEEGCCPHCGSPWARITERKKLTRPRPNAYTKRHGEEGTGNHCANDVAGVSVVTKGWQPSCKCSEHRPVPCLVLDPFAGSGTTLAVAAQLGRSGVGCELNPEYVKLAHERIARSVERERLFA
jgi:DNA modification methylase